MWLLERMANYRRSRICGATYFFAANLADRSRGNLLRHVDILRAAWVATSQEHPFRADAVVVLPDHLHTVWTLPPGDAGFSTRWRKIKARFSAQLEPNPCSISKAARGEKGIWQRRFWEHRIRDAADMEAHLHHCWFNPDKHGLVEQVGDWPRSSFHREVSRGIVAKDWAGRMGGSRSGSPIFGQARPDGG